MGRRATRVVAATPEAIKKKLREAQGSRIEWRVQGRPGLVVISQKDGGGVFWQFYTSKTDGKPKKLRLGAFPALNLAEASRLSLDVRNRIERGEDPSAERQAQRASLTFKELGEKFLAEGPLASNTKQTYRWTLEKDVFPVIGSKPATAVTADDVFIICRTIKARGKAVQTQRTKTTIGGVFKWGVAQGHVKQNPAKDVPNQQEVESRRERVPTDAEIAAIWRAPDGSRMTVAMKLIIRLAILTGQRRSEVAGARLDELHNLQTDQPTWTIAASIAKAGRIVQEGRMKNKSAQNVYLSREAAALFKEAINTCSDGVYAFPADKTRIEGGKTRLPHIHGESVTKAMTRIREKMGIADLTVHDMRRAITTFLGERDDVSDRILDDILHHQSTAVSVVTRKHYDKAKREVALRRAWQLWADHVMEVVTTQVVPETHDEAAPHTL
jgi:integrase